MRRNSGAAVDSKVHSKAEGGSAASVLSPSPQLVPTGSGNLIVDRLPPRAIRAQPNDSSTADRQQSSETAATGNKRPGSSAPPLKVKRKAPWGAQQLRDAWSTDAMTKGERDNMNERIHREYRYHPHEQQRRGLKWVAIAVLPTFVSGMATAYYYYTGKMIWHGDPQYVLNMIRSADTSPRSSFYPYRMEGQEELPEHIVRYRKARFAEIARQKELAAEEAKRAQEALDAAIHGSRKVPMDGTDVDIDEVEDSKTMLDGVKDGDSSTAIEVVPREPKQKPIQYFRITGMAGSIRGVVSDEEVEAAKA